MENNAKLKVGFARVNVNPQMGIDITGYYKIRKAEGILDDLEANAVAFQCGDKTVLLIAIDHCGIPTVILNEYKQAISEKTGVPVDAIFMHSTHTHTGPSIRLLGNSEEADNMILEYRKFLGTRCVDVACFALADLKPAKMGYGIGQAPNIAFIRRFRMKDGTIKTNPGVNNPDIVAPIGEVDESVNVVRFDRENADSVVLVNFADHPDTVGGNLISGDWPSFTRRIVENTKCILINGHQGDVNHVNVHPKAGDFNDMFNDFDGCSRGYGHARHMGQVVAGAVLQVYDKVNYVDVDKINYAQEIVEIPANLPDPKDLPLAHKYVDLHKAGKDDEIPFKAMMLTTVVAEAQRMVRLENGPDHFNLLFSALSIGNIALFGAPGEPFNAIGKAVKKADGWDLILTSCLMNGAEGYYPMKDAYDEGGYEARSSNFKAGVAERIIEQGHKMLSELK